MKIDYSEDDRQIYERELKDFLPSRIFDAHVHLFDGTCLLPGKGFPPKSCLQKFGGTFSMEQCLEWAKSLLPDQEFHLNSFGHPTLESDLDSSATYSGGISDNERFFGMALVSPHDTAESVIRRIEENRLVGYKPYLNFVDWKKPGEITIHDMLPAEQMDYANEKSLAVTLHIPRLERLSDPVNQKQMVELCRNYPGAKIIFAHIGRAYYLSNVIGFLDGIAACPNAYIETAMVNHEGVLEHTFKTFPRDRILFGSDAPIAFMRGKSVEINNQYAYLMGEDYEIGNSIYDANSKVKFTFFFYEQLRGIKLAAKRAGLSDDDVSNIFFNNSNRLFKKIARHNYGKKG